MGESAKALLGGLILLCVIGAGIVWVGRDIPLNGVVWSLRVGLPLVVVVAGWLLMKAAMRRDVEPDFLRQIFRKPFERDGVCFSIIPTIRDGVYYLNVVWQNQYAGACDFRVVIQPPAKSFSFGKRQFGGVAMDVEVPGGALGVASTPLGVPGKFQGKTVVFEVAAATKYREGAGELLRFKNGLRVGKADASGLGSAATTVGLLAVGVIRVSKPATFRMGLPEGVSEMVEPTAPVVRTVWRPGDSAEGVEAKFREAVAGRTVARSVL